jgi:hypothetical protein
MEYLFLDLKTGETVILSVYEDKDGIFLYFIDLPDCFSGGPINKAVLLKLMKRLEFIGVV